MTSSRADHRLLPPRRAGGASYRIAVVCLGNICRSPIGAVILTHRVVRAGLDDAVEVFSAGTGGWHVGEPMDRRAATVLTAHGYDPTAHRATQFDASWFGAHDLILAMDAANYDDLRGLAPLGDSSRLRMFRDFDPRAQDGDRDVPDPYYGGEDGFGQVLATVERTSDTIVAALPAILSGDRGPRSAG